MRKEKSSAKPASYLMELVGLTPGYGLKLEGVPTIAVDPGCVKTPFVIRFPHLLGGGSDEAFC